MTASTCPHMEEIDDLKRQLAIAAKRLEQAQSFIFDLRCLAAKREERGLWVRERDRSGINAAVWGENEGLGSWVSIKVCRRRSPLSWLLLRMLMRLSIYPLRLRQRTSLIRPSSSSLLSFSTCTLSSVSRRPPHPLPSPNASLPNCSITSSSTHPSRRTSLSAACRPQSAPSSLLHSTNRWS